MQQIYLHRDDLNKMIDLLNTIQPADDMLLLKSDSSSGIGTTLTATMDVEVNGQMGEFTATISSVENW